MPSSTLSLNPTDSSTFTGAAFSGLLAAAEREEFVKVYVVRFEPGARTFWHAHSGPQILVVTAGRCRYQRAGEEIRELRAGESVRFEPGVRHWHGAAEAEGTEHVAINLDARETDWQEEADSA
ncbi:MAG TPA: cupin domain-containing protein [Longimicrobiaceae bacterium]|nr:cupin domain-containing protein [Longimicrobiaceae bacterium]